MGRGACGAPARSLKARAIQLLSQREHSRLELRRKLLAHALAQDAQAREAGSHDDPDIGAGEPAADEPAADEPATDVLARLDALLDWLAANHYLCEQRFVESRVHARAARFGNLRIRQELAQHQLGLSADAESALKDSELARARRVWARKFSNRPATPAEHAKQTRFLAGRGFSGEAIRRVLREADRPGVSDETVAPELD